MNAENTPRLVRIMLVDDEPTVLTALRLLLDALGYAVEAFPGGQQALAALRAGSAPDLVICDLKMPELNGIQVLEQVHAHSPRIALALMSAHALPDDVERAKRVGVQGFLAKPFTPEELRALIAALGVG